MEMLKAAAREQQEGNSAPTIQFVNALIERAFDERASDIHLEPQAEEMVVRMRVDGLLHQMLTVPADLKNMVVSRLKIMGSMDIAERRVPQDGHTTVQVRGHVIDLRISTIPTVYGEKLVLRLLDKSSQNLTKTGLGFEGRDLEKYEALLKNSGGVILLVGPTGSGKSTTMCVMLQDLDREEVNIVTLEDPVEYYIPGVNQCQINEKTGMTFASGLRSILRQDPDIIAVGEIRDSETAHIAIRAAITGHLVLSTLHTNDAISGTWAWSRGSFPARCGASSPSDWCGRYAPTASGPTSRLLRSWRPSVCRRMTAPSSTGARAVRSAITPATSAAGRRWKSLW